MDILGNDHVSWFEFDIFTRLFQVCPAREQLDWAIHNCRNVKQHKYGCLYKYADGTMVYIRLVFVFVGPP